MTEQVWKHHFVEAFAFQLLNLQKTFQKAILALPQAKAAERGDTQSHNHCWSFDERGFASCSICGPFDNNETEDDRQSRGRTILNYASRTTSAIAEAVLAEREACAQLAQWISQYSDSASYEYDGGSGSLGFEKACGEIERAIRARATTVEKEKGSDG